MPISTADNTLDNSQIDVLSLGVLGLRFVHLCKFTQHTGMYILNVRVFKCIYIQVFINGHVSRLLFSRLKFLPKDVHGQRTPSTNTKKSSFFSFFIVSIV